MLDLFEKIERFLGIGNHAARGEATREEIAALVRIVAQGIESQDVLFHPGNEKCLAAYVEYGHTLRASLLGKFFKEAPADLVKIYLERGDGISDENLQIILSRQDKDITEALLASGNWVPFPYGSSTSHPLGILHDRHDALEGGIVPAV